MPNSVIAEIVKYGQHTLMCLCLFALAAIGIVLALEKFGPIMHKIYARWLHLDGFGRVMVAAFFCGMWMYGSTKGWVARPNAGHDSNIGIVSICSMQTNIISNAGLATNEVTAIQVKFTGNSVTTNTPFWVRNSSSNDWTRINWANGMITSDLPTNVMECVTATNIADYVYWWLGENLPAVEVETVGITLLNVVESSTSMKFVFTCDNANARRFSVQYQRGSNTTWQVAAQADAAETNVVIVSGFWIGETHKWRIASELGNGGEE